MKTQTTILIVDDDPNFTETLKDGLAAKNVEVRTAGSGTGAVDILEKFIPSVIILDVQLPDMHGFELCRVIRKSSRLKNVPVILLSAKYTEPADRAEGMLAEADAFLSKPVNVEALWEEMKYLLDKKA